MDMFVVWPLQSGHEMSMGWQWPDEDIITVLPYLTFLGMAVSRELICCIAQKLRPPKQGGQYARSRTRPQVWPWELNERDCFVPVVAASPISDLSTHPVNCVASSVAQYQGTTTALCYHFSTLPVPSPSVPSPLWYFFVPQYHKYHGSSAWYLSVVDTVTNIC